MELLAPIETKTEWRGEYRASSRGVIYFPLRSEIWERAAEIREIRPRNPTGYQEIRYELPVSTLPV